MAVATIKIKIEKDGKLKLITDEAIPSELHADADALFDHIEAKYGCERQTEHLAAGHVYETTHSHDHVHNHN